MLDIDMQFKKGILLVRLTGVLNGDTVGIYKNNLEDIIKDNGIKYVLINLKKLDYIDEYGFEAIKNSYIHISNNNGKLILCGINKLFDKNKYLTNNLYQVSEEVAAYDIVNI